MKEEDILDYLMSSEFNEGMSDQESQFLLLKFRQHYRLLVSKSEQMKYRLDEVEKKMSEVVPMLEKMIGDKDIELTQMDANYKKQLNRKLTLGERFSGKIKYTK